MLFCNKLPLFYFGIMYHKPSKIIKMVYMALHDLASSLNCFPVFLLRSWYHGSFTDLHIPQLYFFLQALYVFSLLPEVFHSLNVSDTVRGTFLWPGFSLNHFTYRVKNPKTVYFHFFSPILRAVVIHFTSIYVINSAIHF